jgi:integrase
VRLVDLQDLVDKLVASGLSASTVQCALLPLRAMYRRALQRGEVAVNPTAGLAMPAIRGRRERIAAPVEGAALLAALPASDRAVWATAMSAALRDHLIEHRMATGRSEGLVFGTDGKRPFDPSKLTMRARSAWGWAKVPDESGSTGCSACTQWIAGPDALEPITLHECRHTFASLMIAAGVNAKALSTYMGHFSISITLDLYGHLMPGNEDEAAVLLDAYLTRVTEEAARSVAPTVARTAEAA